MLRKAKARLITTAFAMLAPYNWGEYWPTLVEVGITIGSFGFFFTLFSLFVKALPPMAIMELKEAAEPPMRKGHHEH